MYWCIKNWGGATATANLIKLVTNEVMIFTIKTVKLLVLVGVTMLVGVVGARRERTFTSTRAHPSSRGRGNGRIVGQRQILYDHYGKLMPIVKMEITHLNLVSSSKSMQDWEKYS